MKSLSQGQVLLLFEPKQRVRVSMSERERKKWRVGFAKAGCGEDKDIQISWTEISAVRSFLGFCKIILNVTQRKTNIRLIISHFNRKLLWIQWPKPAPLSLSILQSRPCLLCPTEREAVACRSLWPGRHSEWPLVPGRSQVPGTRGPQPTSKLWK